MTEAVGRLVGRDRELERLRAVLGAPTSWPAALLLEGEAGAGKTALWTAGLELARGCRILRARPTGAEAQLAFSALGDLLEGLGDDALAELPGLQRRALEAALLIGEEEAPDADLRAVAVAVLSVLRRLAAERPVVLAVDDEQWLDAPTAAALTFALRRLRDEPVLVLAARRTASARAPVSGLAAAFEAGRVQRIAPGPLDLESLRRVLERELGVSWTRPVLVRIHATSGGNPLYALELARALARGDAAVPATLRGLLSERLSRLPTSAVEALAVAAACDQPDVTLLAAAMERDVAADVEAAAAAGIVVREGGRIRFAHPLLAAVAHAAAPEPRRREIHRRLAAVLQEPEQRAM
ncbi:MAG TPA: AAA family ATPase, partial [Solirubrobacteraceae bacterium]|nr:AAA family ATPase [Solirubrobacteraceae bacterium]